LDREITLRDYGRVLWSGRWLILATTIAAAIVGLLLTFARSPEYTSKAKVFLGQATTVSGVIAQTPTTSVLTAGETLEGDDVISTVARTLGISESRVRRDASVDIPRPPGNVGANQPAVANITFVDPNRRIAQDGVDAYAEAVLNRLNINYLGVQQVLERQIQRAQNQVKRLNTQIKLYAGEATKAGNQQQLALYQSLLFAAQSQLATAQQSADTNALLLEKGKQIEAPSIVSKSTNPTSSGAAPARLRTMLFGAIIGFLIGVIATFVWKGSPAGRAAPA
jgi:LPS O-antigen subunit length determinant protein (WzzB/FepE family)